MEEPWLKHNVQCVELKRTNLLALQQLGQLLKEVKVAGKEENKCKETVF
jgi:hypothetical protein